MPWSNQSGGGGGWKSNNGGGPWGGGSGGGGGGGPWGGGGGGGQGGGSQPPDLEEILRRSQDRIKTVLPGGGGTLFIPVVIIALIGLWVWQSIYTVQPDELGVELVFGKPKDEVSEQGLHFHWWPIETVEIVPIRQNRVALGASVGGRSSNGRDAGLMLSGDQNIVDVDFTVIWRVSDPGKFLFNVNDPESFVRGVAESSMREFVGRSRAEDVRTEKRQELQDSVKTVSQEILDSYEAGITVLGVQLERADPPADVSDAFEEVQRAQQDQDKFQQEAQAYSNKRLGEARGEASKIREEAKAYRERVIAEADGEAQRFVAVYDQYVLAKDVTRKRLYLETLERVLKDANKVVIEKGGTGVVPYLALPEISKQNQGGQ